MIFKRVSTVLWAVAAGSVILRGPVWASNESKLHVMELKAVQNRRQIKRGKIRLTVRQTRCKSQPSYEELTRKYYLVFDGDSYRMDIAWIFSGKKTMYFKILTPNAVLMSGRPSSPIIVNRRAGRTLADVGIPDPRRLGMAPVIFTSLCQCGLETILLRPDRQLFSLKQEKLDGRTTWRCDYTVTSTDNPSRCTTWIAPEAGYSLVRYKGATVFSDHRYVTELFVKPKFYSNGKVWFPQQVKYRESKDDELILEEICVVESAEFGATIPQKEFTAAALGLPEGREFFVHNKLMTNHKGKLVPGRPTRRVPTESHTRARYSLIIVSLALAGMAAVAFVLYRSAATRSSAR